MDALRALPLQKGWVYEVLLCTYSGDAPHAAPFGVWTDDFATLEIDMYAGSRTLANVLAAHEFVAAFPTGVSSLSDALFAPERLRFTEAATVHAPSPTPCHAAVELVVRDATPTAQGTHVSALPRRTQVAGAFTPLNRAEGLLLESLVLATRIERLGESAVTARLSENRRVVARVAPGSPMERAMAELLRSLGPAS
jgi:hypothetical protein